jgi:hypothetical protein
MFPQTASGKVDPLQASRLKMQPEVQSFLRAGEGSVALESKEVGN